MAVETIQDRRLESLKNAVKQIEQQFGRGAIMKLGGSAGLAEIETISTGSLAVDLALGGRGLPKGRIVEVFGPEASGKTSLCMGVVAEVQRRGGVAAYLDAEHAVDPAYAAKLGVNLESLLLSQPDSMEQALEIAEILVRSNGCDLVVVDSVAALVPRAELEGEMGELQVGLQARLMSQAMRKLTGAISRSKATAVFINQIREKIGVMFGNPETTPGGRALKFYSSVRIEVRRVSTLKDGDTPVGTRVRANVVKNKIAPPFKKAEFDLLFGEGISRSSDLLDLGEELGVLEKNGSSISFKTEKLGAGRDKARQFLNENRKVAAALEAEIRRKLGLASEPAAAAKRPASAPPPAKPNGAN
jgi:recombination protein RecA